MKLTRAICSAIAILALSGCAGLHLPSPNITLFHAADPAPPPVCPVRPAPRKWTAQEQRLMVTEVNATPKDDILRVLRADWKRMRDGLK